MAPIHILPLGACLMRGPLNPVHKEGDRLQYAKYGPLAPCYTLGIMFQELVTLRGDVDVPQEIRPLCGMAARAGAIAGADSFADVDVVLIEPASPTEIPFLGCSLHRIALPER